MGKRVGTLLAVLGFLVFAAPAIAQDGGTTVYFGAGYANGVSDTGDATDPGWLGVAGLLFGVGEGNISLGGEGFYGSLAAVTDGVDSTKLYGAMGVVELSFGDGDSVSPYVFGGAGLLAADMGSSTESQFGYEGGVGLGFPLGGVSLWVEGRYMGSSDVDLIAILAGLAIG